MLVIDVPAEKINIEENVQVIEYVVASEKRRATITEASISSLKQHYQSNSGHTFSERNYQWQKNSVVKRLPTLAFDKTEKLATR